MYVEGIPHCIAFWDKSREEDMSDDAELICIHSLQEHWGKGYGSIMMNLILSEIMQQGFSKVMLWVFTENIRARRFYEKHGFIVTENRKQFANAEEIMYCKTL